MIRIITFCDRSERLYRIRKRFLGFQDLEKVAKKKKWPGMMRISL